MRAEAQREHQWLQKFVGLWTYASEVPGEDGQVHRYTGSERVRALGDLWIVGEGEGEMPGESHGKTLLTVGYDPARGCYRGTWIGSMMTHLWIYERGTLDEAAQALTLESTGPGMTPGTTARYRDVFTFHGDGRRVLTSYIEGEGGEWQPMMSTTYRRSG